MLKRYFKYTIQGLATFSDFTAVLYSLRVRKRLLRQSDFQALKSDWEKTGEDMKLVYKSIHNCLGGTVNDSPNPKSLDSALLQLENESN